MLQKEIKFIHYGEIITFDRWNDFLDNYYMAIDAHEPKLFCKRIVEKLLQTNMISIDCNGEAFLTLTIRECEGGLQIEFWNDAMKYYDWEPWRSNGILSLYVKPENDKKMGTKASVEPIRFADTIQYEDDLPTKFTDWIASFLGPYLLMDSGYELSELVPNEQRSRAPEAVIDMDEAIFKEMWA